MRFWGKASPYAGAAHHMHPLPWHSLDVAAVMHVMLWQGTGALRRLAGVMGTSTDDCLAIMSRLAALHDIGKFSQRFQAKNSECFPQDVLGVNPSALVSTGYDHASAGHHLFQLTKELAWFALPENAHYSWTPLMAAATGHHGSPPIPLPLTVQSMGSLRREWGKASVEAAFHFARSLQDILPLPPNLALNERCAKRASHLVAGAMVLSDWIGSRQEWFPYERPSATSGTSLGRYFSTSKDKAREALRAAGVRPAPFRNGNLLGDILGGRKPRPLQSWASKCRINEGPALYVIEAETGAGKTEAAMTLAHRIVQAHQLDGVYMALPTMATSNAMFERMRHFAKVLRQGDDTPITMVLSHSGRDMHKGFREMVDDAHAEQERYDHGTTSADDLTASAHCTAWLSDDRRRSFLCDLGVGTVDQAVLSVLGSRHQSLRLWALANRALITDEAHSYDTYMQAELERLVEFQAGLRGSVVVLSATLSANALASLSKAFRKGLDNGAEDAAPPGDGATSYPMITVVSAHGTEQVKDIAPSGRKRSVAVRLLPSPDEALSALYAASKAGECVAYVRNSVQDAVDAYRELAKVMPDSKLHLLHARMALCDRLAKEQEVLRIFGKGGVAAERAGCALVATQIVEQSLDLDFDAMFTDLAPIDALIQRAGRLRRHERVGRMGDGELCVVSPPPTQDAGKSWVRALLPRTAKVYADHARLWLSAKVLEDAGSIDAPSGIRDMIESVYGPNVDEGCPPSLNSSGVAARGRDMRARSLASNNLLMLKTGYACTGGQWGQERAIATRLIESPTVCVRLGVLSADGKSAHPYAGDASEDIRLRWRMSEVQVQAYLIDQEFDNPDEREARTKARADWPQWDNSILVILRPDGKHAWRGAAMREGDPDPVLLLYSRLTGIEAGQGAGR